MKDSGIHVKISDHHFSSEVRECMWQVYQPHYHYSKDSFMQRIANHNYYAMYYRADQLVGFTGLRIEKSVVAQERRFTIYFGQTIIDPSVRSQALIPRTGIQLCKMFWRDLLTHKAYFWADALTYKAYLVFAKTLEEYYPTRVRVLPPYVKTLRDYLGEKYYGDRYCSINGTVRKDEYVVADSAIRNAPRRSLDADVKYFRQANPRHEAGSGLLTIAPIHRTNVMMIVRKIIQKNAWFVQHRQRSRKLRIQARLWVRSISTTLSYAGL